MTRTPVSTSPMPAGSGKSQLIESERSSARMTDKGRELGPIVRTMREGVRATPDGSASSFLATLRQGRIKFSRMHAWSERAAHFSPSDDVVGFLASRRIRALRSIKNNIAAARLLRERRDEVDIPSIRSCARNHSCRWGGRYGRRARQASEEIQNPAKRNSGPIRRMTGSSATRPKPKRVWRHRRDRQPAHPMPNSPR